MQPSTSSTAAEQLQASAASNNQVTALYAPVSRKTVNSPNKQIQTITINFN